MLTRRFFFAVFLIQLATIGLFYAAVQAGLDNRQLILTIGLLELLFTLLASFWLSSMARQHHQDQLDAIKEAHAREREEIRVHAERQKTRFVNRKHRELLKNQRRTDAAANFKIGAVFAASILFGAAMLYTQLVTFGLLVLSTSGGALAGYLLRGRRLARSRNLPTARVETGKIADNRLPDKKNPL
jgi:Flp pilus assembly protein TadB